MACHGKDGMQSTSDVPHACVRASIRTSERPILQPSRHRAWLSDPFIGCIPSKRHASEDTPWRDNRPCIFPSGRRGKDSSNRMEIASRKFSTSLAEHGEARTTNVDGSRQTDSDIFSTKRNSDRCQMQRIHIYLSRLQRMASCFSKPRSYALFRKAEKDLLAMIFHGYPLRSGVSGRHSSPPFRDSSPGG